MPDHVQQALALAARFAGPHTAQPNACRVAYISGRYRIYNEDGTLNDEAMQKEVESEARWARIVGECGHAWIAPLNNSVPVEQAGLDIPGDRYVDFDLAIVRRLRSGWDILVMRPGWDRPLNEYNPPSSGATKEHWAGEQQGALILTPNSEAEGRRMLMRLALAAVGTD